MHLCQAAMPFKRIVTGSKHPTELFKNDAYLFDVQVKLHKNTTMMLRALFLLKYNITLKIEMHVKIKI